MRAGSIADPPKAGRVSSIADPPKAGRVLSIAVVALATFGCASREAPLRVDAGPDDAALDATDAGKVLPEGAADALAANHRVFCRSFKACFPVQFANLYGDEDTCVARRLKLSEAVLFGPGSLLTTADVQACGRAYGDSYTCDQILRIFYENPVTPADCRLRGTLANGSVCAGADQCKSGYCRYETTSACGACADRVSPGGPCSADTQCAEGFACATGKCVPFVDRGGACDASRPCHVADVCRGGVCSARVPLDAACDPTLQDCVVGSSCSFGSRTCVSVVGGGLGTACGFVDGGGLALCDPGLKCKITNIGAYTGACVPAAKQGEACFRTGPSGSQCETPLLCASSGCVLPSTDTCR